MALADFIDDNIQPILMEWEEFARQIPSITKLDPTELRDHAEEILRACADDMRTPQSEAEESNKSKGFGEPDLLDQASDSHAIDRVKSGFSLGSMVSEYRALRSSVTNLWRKSFKIASALEFEELTRFNQSMDQALAGAIAGFDREIIKEQAKYLSRVSNARSETEIAHRAIATLSHELRTPLNAIVGWTAILQTKGCDEKDLQEGLAVIDRNAKTQVKLINDMLDISRVMIGKLQLDIADCELSELITASVNDLRRTAEAKEIAIEVRIDPNASRSAVDATRMRQVIWNLVSNAIKFTQNRGQIIVTLCRSGSDLHIEIDISDNGIGISPELLPHIFDRFRQADSSTRRKFGGLGLGLAIVKELVELHDGKVTASSAGDGKGAKFVVTLPVKAVSLTDVVLTTMPEPNILNNIRILVVDDEPDARRMLTKVLTGHGAIVLDVSCVTDAIKALKQHIDSQPFDILISDIGMPEQDGYDLIKFVRQTGIKIPALALTAFVQEDDRSQAIEAGFNEHAAKPVSPQDLISTVKRLMK